MKIKPGAPLLVVALLISPAVFSQDQTEAAFESQLDTTPNANATAPAAPAAAPAQTASQGSAPKQTGLQPAGQVVWVSGAVKASYPEQTPRILARGSMIYEKDTIITESSGSGQISFTDNSMITLNGNSTLVIEQYYFNQQKPQQGGQSVMNLVKGSFRTVTGFVAKAAPANYQMKTPVATIGVRGTDFQGACSSNSGQCAFALLHGAGLTITNAAGTFNVTPEAPYASVASFTTKAIIGKTPSSTLGPRPTITPADAPAPGGPSSGNCGILIN